MSTLSDLSPSNSAFHTESPGSPTRTALSDMLSRNKFLEGKGIFDTPFPLLIKIDCPLYFSILNCQLLVFSRIGTGIKLICNGSVNESDNTNYLK